MSKRKKKSSKRTIYVEGMHCASCEVLIEKKLLKQDGIKSVDASLKGNKVDLSYVGDKNPNIQKLNKEFKSYGYKFSNNEIEEEDTPVISIEDGSLIINPEKLKLYLKLFLIASSFLIAFYLFEKLQLGQYVSVDSTSALPAFLLLGIVAGLSSCAALVGGLLLSMTKQWNEVYIDSQSKKEKAKPHIMFHIGRLISFTVLGGVLGLIGERLSLNNTTFFAILTIAVSIIMFILAMQMLEVGWARKLKFTAPKFLTRFVADEENFQGKYMPFATGALTFLLPCGFTLIAQTVALTSGSFIQGSLIMLLFALGTFPTLLAISYSGIALNSKPHLTAKFNLVAGLLIVFFAIYNVNGQLNVLGMPSLSNITFAKSDKVEEKVIETDADGQQIINITAQGFSYIPTSSTTIKAGVPTKLVVDDQGIQGCGAYIAATGLFDNYVALQRGTNEIDLGQPKKGTYKLTCSMGMVSPVIIKVI